tara:strand:- start:26836 stop:27024 length:189 start_codon:yes stop_codon:yes gene_type:complete
MSEKLLIVEDINDDNVLAFRTKASVAIDFNEEILKFSDLNYSFEEVLSIAKKIEQIKESRLL